MAQDAVQKVGYSLDLQSTAKIKNLPQSSTSGEAVEHDQLSTALNLKQDVVTAGSGLIKDGSTLNVNLATAGSDYTTFNVVEAAYPSLEGEYTRLNYQAYLDYAGTDLDLDFGGDFNGYYKDNGSGIWAVIFRREIDGNAATSDSGTWMAVLTTIDPTTVIATVNSYIPDYQAVDYDSVAGSDVVAENTFRSPSEGGYGLNSDTSYQAGSTPAGLKFENSKLAIDFASTTGEASSTKVFPSSIVKTYVDEQVVDAKELSNHPFNNTVAGLSGNPTNAQSAIEAAASEINTLDSQVSALQVQDVGHSAFLEDHRLALGVSQGQDNLGSFPEGTSVFIRAIASPTTDPVDVKSALSNIGARISEVYSNVGALTGLAAGETDFGGGFVILPNDSDVKALFQATEAELQNLSQGLGQFWQPVAVALESNIDLSVNPSSTLGGRDMDASINKKVLLSAQTNAHENGVYLYVNDSALLTRIGEADASADFSPNKTVQVLESGKVWAYIGSDDPVIGTDSLPFEVKFESVIPDQSITEAKLESGLDSKLNAKTDKFAQTVTVPSSGALTVTHNLNSVDVIVQIKDSTGELINAAEITNYTANTVDVAFLGGLTDARIIVIG